jgi:hypothetical protein
MRLLLNRFARGCMQAFFEVVHMGSHFGDRGDLDGVWPVESMLPDASPCADRCGRQQ